MNERLKARVETLKADLQAETGAPFKHFFCPFLHVDEPVPLCEGQIINEAFGTSNAWVPQRQDLDNFFGSRVEADFISAVQDRTKTDFEKWIDPKLNRRYRPQIFSKAEAVGHYIPKQIKSEPGHTPLSWTNTGGA